MSYNIRSFLCFFLSVKHSISIIFIYIIFICIIIVSIVIR